MLSFYRLIKDQKIQLNPGNFERYFCWTVVNSIKLKQFTKLSFKAHCVKQLFMYARELLLKRYIVVVIFDH